MPSRGRDHSVISQEVHFVEIDSASGIHEAGAAPYLDYRPTDAQERAKIAPMLEQDWLKGEQLERRAVNYAIENLVQRHVERIREPQDERLDKTERADQERLTREFYYWDGRAAQLRAQEEAGKHHARLNSSRHSSAPMICVNGLARGKREIDQERQISATRPIVAGGALIIPIGLLQGENIDPQVIDTHGSEKIAMDAVMAAERELGNRPLDVSMEKRDYDIESKPPGENAKLRFNRGQGPAKRRLRCDADQE